MKTIVCFGDSNTWGYDPAASSRHPHDRRWTGVLQSELGAEYRIIEEGLNGRTTTVDDPIHDHRNGRTYLPPCLESHAPFELVIIMLGTNDLKARFNRSGSDIAESAGILTDIARRSPVGPGGRPPKVLLIAPPPITQLTDLDEMFAGGYEKSRTLARYYKLRAARYGATFFDAGSVVSCSDLDGIHIEAPEHATLGKAIAAVARDMLG